MHSADALLNTLGVPRQVVVDEGLTELKIQTFSARLGAEKDPRTRAEFVYESKPKSDIPCQRAALRRPSREVAGFFLLPERKRFLCTLAVVVTTKQSYLTVGDSCVDKEVPEKVLGSQRFCEDHDLPCSLATRRKAFDA